MKELSWQEILKSQQIDFMKRLASHFTDQYSLDFLGYTPIVLSCLTSDSDTEKAYPHLREFGYSELVKVDLDYGEYMNIDHFCNEMVDKYYRNERRVEDEYTNWRIGKLGEEAVKRCLGDLVTDVSYRTDNYGDGGVDFQLVSNKYIGIQVKTKARYRDWDENEMVNYIHYIDIECFARLESLGSHIWSLNQKEIDANKVIICLLMLNGIQGDKIYGKTYDFVMSGFLPTQNIKDNKNQYFMGNDKYQLKMKDLLYSGGMQGYLEFLAKSQE
jgi:hypothetical protein